MFLRNFVLSLSRIFYKNTSNYIKVEKKLSLEEKRQEVEAQRELISQKHVASHFNKSQSLINRIIMGERTDNSGIIEYCYRLIECIKHIDSTSQI